MSIHQKTLNTILNILVVAPIIFMFLTNNSKILKEFVIYLVIIQTIRLLFISVTILPKNKNCVVPEKYTLNNVLFGHCYDKLFSGHVATATLIAIILYNNKMITNKSLLYFYVFIVSLLMIFLRGHYTIDIIIGILAPIAIYNSKLIQVVYKLFLVKLF